MIGAWLVPMVSAGLVGSVPAAVVAACCQSARRGYAGIDSATTSNVKPISQIGTMPRSDMAD